jgi:hypothetical protein
MSRRWCDYSNDENLPPLVFSKCPNPCTHPKSSEPLISEIEMSKYFGGIWSRPPKGLERKPVVKVIRGGR